MTRTERLLAILQMLREQRRPVTAATIAERFAVSERTAYRDIVTLNDQGATIVGEAGIGFMLRDDYFIPPLSFDFEEAAALMLGLRFALRRGDAALASAAGRARAKLAAALPARFDDDAGTASGLVVAPRPERHEVVLAALRDAIARPCKARIRYKDGKGDRRDRIVWPILIGWFDGFEMFAAWCELRQAFRHVRIDRLAEVALLEERPDRPRRTLLAEYRLLEPDIDL